VQPVTLNLTKIPASTTEFKLKQYSQAGLYIFYGGPVWYTDGSKTNKGTGVGAYNGVKKGT
jgi:hypothetical protein